MQAKPLKPQTSREKRAFAWIMTLGSYQIPGFVADTSLSSVETGAGLNRSERALFIHHDPSHLPVNKPLMALRTRFQLTCQTDRFSTSETHLVKQLQIYVLCSLQTMRSDICWGLIGERFFWCNCLTLLFSYFQCVYFEIVFQTVRNTHVSWLLHNFVCGLGILSCSYVTL